MIQKIRFKTLLAVSAILILTIFLARPLIEEGFNRITIFDSKEYAIDFIDDSGLRIKMEKPAERIISLYSAHTENLFSLGLDHEIIGVGTSDIYPVAVFTKQVYDYKSDPEKVISARPDVVIIRPFIERKSPNFVNALKRAGITVVSLYPDTYEEFDDYIIKLGMVIGREKTARRKLDEFYAELDEIKELTSNIEERVGVYFESSDREYKTVTKNSMASVAIEAAGGINVASDAIPIEKGSSIAAYGIEKILEKANEIDVYVSQRGVMGAGGNYHSISIRPGFHAIKAVKKEKIYEINQKIISSPTFRFIKGVKELCRMFYPEIFDKQDYEFVDKEITREELAEVLIKYTHKTIFVPTSSYYRTERKGHPYGFFEDVPYSHPCFDIIETAVNKGFFEGYVEDNVEKFYPDKFVTRDGFAQIVYLISELSSTNNHIEVNDLNQCDNERIIQMVVDYKIMDLDNGSFNPKDYVTWREVLTSLERLSK